MTLTLKDDVGWGQWRGGAEEQEGDGVQDDVAMH